MTLIKELKYDLNINGENITDLSDFESKWSINSARELKLLFESEKGALSEKYHLGDEISFRYGIGKINPINDFHGVCQGIDLNEYSLLNYDWLTKLIDEEVKIKKSKYLGWEKMSVIRDAVNTSNIAQRLFQPTNVGIDENFTSNPSDWINLYGAGTHDAVNGWMQLSIVMGGGKGYYKELQKMDDQMNFKFHFDYEATYKSIDARIPLVCFNKSNKDRENFMGVIIYDDPLTIVAIIYSDDGTGYSSYPSFHPTINVQYRYDFDYDKNSRIMTLKIYEVNVLKDTVTVHIPSDKKFEINAMGGWGFSYSQANEPGQGNYDNAYFESERVSISKLKGTYPQQYVTPYDDLKNSLKENRFGFIMKVLNSMYDATNWHEIKLYEMWLRYDTLIIQKQRSLTSSPVMTIADADNLITTKPVIDKERICNQCAIIDKDDEDIFFVYSDESSIGAYGLFCKNFGYKAYGQVDKCQEIAMKYVAKHKMPTKVFGLSCADGYMLQLGDIVQVTADRYGIKGKYRITDIMTRARDLPSAEITVSDKQPDISEFL